jgi:hypothetical protein
MSPMKRTPGVFMFAVLGVAGCGDPSLAPSNDLGAHISEDDSHVIDELAVAHTPLSFEDVGRRLPTIPMWVYKR